jgi:FtsH-binding integral membrane protein
MSTDTWRLHYTYLIGAGVLALAFGLLLLHTPDISGESKLAFVTFVAGIVLGFVFNRETQERAIEQGANGGIRESTLTGQATPGVLRDQVAPPPP